MKKPGRAAQTRRSRPTLAETGPHQVDIHVGSRIKLARLLAKRTQQWLAGQVSLTFQQIQKYEHGANRVSCSMLSEFAVALERPVGWFFEGDQASPSEPGTDPELVERQHLVQELASNFSKIAHETTRRQIVGLTRAIAEDDS